MRNMELDRVVKQYILDAISSEGYDVDIELIMEANKQNISFEEYDKGRLQFIYNNFKSEYGWSIERVGEHKAFTEWIQGLPSSFNVDFENYKILELARKWGSISPDLKGKALERREDLILSGWFNFITVKTFQLFKKYKIN
jgi:hypothetical protein